MTYKHHSDVATADRSPKQPGALDKHFTAGLQKEPGHGANAEVRFIGRLIGVAYAGERSTWR